MRIATRFLAVLALLGATVWTTAAGAVHPAAAQPPPRVLLVGDSIMVQSGTAAADELRAAGAEVVEAGISGSGLLTGWDWVAGARDLVATHHPDAVAVLFVGNYFPPYVLDEQGEEILPGSPGYYDLWESRADELMAELTVEGAEVLWVSPPPMADPGADHMTRGIWERFVDVADRWPGTGIVPAGEYLIGPDGDFEFTFMTCSGSRPLRAADGGHLDSEGALRMGRAIAGGLAGVLEIPGIEPPPVRQPTVGIEPAAGGSGYVTVTCGGEVDGFGAGGGVHGVSADDLAGTVVDLAIDPAGPGGWLVDRQGRVTALDGALDLGPGSRMRLHRPIVGMAATPSGHGYWLVASDGGIFAFGDAAFHGSTGGIRLHRPIVGMAARPSGHGYWLVASDGGIFAFGDAAFRGSTGDRRLDESIVGMAPTPSGLGYWLAARDGGIFSFGDAPFLGSTASLR